MMTAKTINLEYLLYKVLQGILALVMLTVLCIPQMIHAQGHPNQSGQYNGIAYLAEKEIRSKKQSFATNKKTTHASIKHLEEGYAESNEKTTPKYGTDEAEN